MTGRDIFISYNREERAAARHFAESFDREGFSVWWDAALRSGQTFDEVIEKELRAAKAVVVLWSPRSVASRWVRAEATLADRNNKLVPVIIEACNLPIIFELTQAADLADWTGDTLDTRWQTLVSDLRRLVDHGHEEIEQVSKTTKPAESRTDPVGKAAEEPDKEALMLALARINKAQAPDLLKPTDQEEQLTQFYRESDQFRAREQEQHHCLLRLDEDDQTETSIIVGTAGLKLGRTAPADVIVTGLGVSRAHCQVDLEGGQLWVTDLNSTNGTFIDNKRIDGKVALPKGSVLQVGDSSFRHDIFTRAEAMRYNDPANFASPAGSTTARIAGS